MTKAQRIIDLYDGTRSTAEIAAIVGCSTAYVRAAVGRMKNPGRDAQYCRDYVRLYAPNGDVAAAEKARETARSKALAAGKSRKVAAAYGSGYYQHELVRTGRLAAKIGGRP